MSGSATDRAPVTAPSPIALLAPLALAQFICSFAGANLNVMITDIQHDLDTTVKGVQTVITLFLLIMAVLMIPGSKLTDRWGRKRSLVAGLVLYGVGALLSAVAPNLLVLIIGNSVFEGVGTALLIPPVYILATLWFRTVTTRAWAFGIISAAAGVGAAAGPLLGGLIASALSWRFAFVFQAIVVGVVLLLTIRLKDPLPTDRSKPFDYLGALLSAIGLSALVFGLLNLGDNNTLAVILVGVGVLGIIAFFLYVRASERGGREPLLSTRLFRSRGANLALITQNVQWLVLNGASFVVSVYLQTVRGYSPIATGVVFTAATVGMLVTSVTAERLARWFSQRTLIIFGFASTVVGIVLVVGLVAKFADVWALIPGLFLLGFGIGAMLTPSVNVVQSSFPDELQSEISGLSRSVSNLGSALGTALAGTILVSIVRPGDEAYAISMLFLGVVAIGGLIAAIALPKNVGQPTA
ncbi:MFS transporter [Protaetiibacter larvae]|uniref:MFS transporter n=1 Tax=Protaetiibacter larvae TaxID=2592654 RepID=A0A5C1Y743_9MICO|nr:MFS transporter [Protaetiibacter larvae]QEO09754.1 MFS transporter [Protaetiibacter larvae]